MLQLTDRTTQWSICLDMHQILFHRGCGHFSPDPNPVDYEVWGVLQRQI